MGKLVIFRRCATLHEALIVGSLLQAGGYYHSISEYHTSSVQWDIVPALGGVSIWVCESQLLEIGNYLLAMRRSASERLAEEFGPVDQSPMKLRWGRAATMLIIYSGFGYLLLLPVIALLMILPVDLVASAPEPYSEWHGYTPEISAAPKTIWNLPKWNPEGFLLILALAALLFADVMSVMTDKRTELTGADDTQNSDESPRP